MNHSFQSMNNQNENNLNKLIKTKTLKIEKGEK